MHTYSYIKTTTTIKCTPRDVRTIAAGIGSSCGFNGLFCIMKGAKSPGTIEMPSPGSFSSAPPLDGNYF